EALRDHVPGGAEAVAAATAHVAGGADDVGAGRFAGGEHGGEDLGRVLEGAGQPTRPQSRLPVDDGNGELDASRQIGDGRRRVVVAVVDEDHFAQHAG